jgi:hypothetical protein
VLNQNKKGINDPKIQFHEYLADKVQPQAKGENLELNSFIISNTKWIEVNWKDSLSIDDFNKQHVYFQEDQSNQYIRKMVEEILD